MAMNIHMSVRYLQSKKENPNISNSEAYFGLLVKCFGQLFIQFLQLYVLFISYI